MQKLDIVATHNLSIWYIKARELQVAILHNKQVLA